jgi:hypothetical protein
VDTTNCLLEKYLQMTLNCLKMCLAATTLQSEGKESVFIIYRLIIAIIEASGIF